MVEDARADKVKGSTIEKEMDADWKKLDKYVKAVGGYTDEELGDDPHLVHSVVGVPGGHRPEEGLELGQRKLTPSSRSRCSQPIMRGPLPRHAARALEPGGDGRGATSASTRRSWTSTPRR